VNDSIRMTTLPGLQNAAFLETVFFVSTSALISDAEGRLLLARRSNVKKLDPGRWETPGGFLEGGELPLDGLRRELREELGVEIVRWRLFDVFQHRDFTHPNLVIVYEVRVSGEMTLNLDEIAEVRWFEEGEIGGLEFASNCADRVRAFWSRQREGLEGWPE